MGRKLDELTLSISVEVLGMIKETLRRCIPIGWKYHQTPVEHSRDLALTTSFKSPGGVPS